MANPFWNGKRLSEAERNAIAEIAKRNGHKIRPAATEFESNHNEFFEDAKPKPKQK